MHADATTSSPPAEAPLPGSLGHRPGYLLAKNHMHALELASTGLAPHGLTAKHFGCLTMLVDGGPMSQQTLGGRLRIDRTTTVALVDELERSGHVVRRRNPEDRRAYALEITAAGRRSLKAAGAAMARAEDELLAPLDEGERAELIRLLRKLLLRG